MKPVIDLDVEYSLVLEGGGAKGAYQIGAWKALKEAGVKINAVAGTSVGALNGALICMDDVDKALNLWENISYSKVMDVDDTIMNDLLNRTGKIRENTKEVLRIIKDKGADVTPLKNMISENIDEEIIRNGHINFYLLTFSLSDFRELDLDLKEEPEGLLEDYLLASAYLPVFKNEKLHGKKYMDGGIINNVPLSSLITRGYKNIIMIRIFGIGREPKVKIPDDVEVYSIEPKVNLGNILDFSSSKSRRNIKIGYYDACRFIYGLKGKIYYIDENEKEWYYLEQLTNISEELMIRICLSYGATVAETDSILRTYLEEILPVIADLLKLQSGWTYKELYISILEASAKLLKVKKYNIYSVQELENEVIARYEKNSKADDIPDFVSIITKSVIIKEDNQ